MSAPPRPALVVAGMHRSGTSVSAMLLRSAGLRIGRRLLARGAQGGYGEDLDFLEWHQEALRQRGLSPSGWTLESEIPLATAHAAAARSLVRRKARGRAWGWKDPRTTLFLGFWHELLPQARFAFVYRAPWAVADSLFRRGDFEFFWRPRLAVEMWIHYNRRLLELARREPRRCLLAAGDAIVARPRAWIAALADHFGLALAPPDQGLVIPGLLRCGSPEPAHRSAIGALYPEALALYAELQARDALAPQPPAAGGEHLPRAEDPDWVLARWMESRRARALGLGAPQAHGAIAGGEAPGERRTAAEARP